MKRLRALLMLCREFMEFAAANKAWWLLPIAVILLGVGAVIALSGSATPLIYTLF
jgi:hypothetical protein